MLVNLAYGHAGTAVEVPDDATVILPTELPGLADQQRAVTAALAHPLSGRGKDRVAQCGGQCGKRGLAHPGRRVL